MTHIFISYSKQDIEFARYLRALLEDAGFPVWLDEARLSPSTRWWKDIEQSINGCAAFMVIMSPDAQESDWVEREILLAENLHKPIYPVLLAENPWSRLANIQYEDLRAGLHATLSPRLVNSLRQSIAPRPPGSIAFTIETDNILTVAADVIVLKHAQAFRGADAQVAKMLVKVSDVERDSLRLQPGDSRLVETNGAVTAAQALFLGTAQVQEFSYGEVREFAQRTLATLAQLAPDIRHLAMTVHGVRTSLRLDQTEVLRSQIAGYFDALQARTYPTQLEHITIVEFDEATTARLRLGAEQIFAKLDNATAFEAGWGYHLLVSGTDAPATVMDANVRPHAYIIMPDEAALEDVFYFGIQQPTHAHGLLCERTPTIFAEAAVLEQVKQRISAASVVIADVTYTDDMLYLQLGYAWGQQRPTILIAQAGTTVNLPEATCVYYSSIKQLENLLSERLNALRDQGIL